LKGLLAFCPLFSQKGSQGPLKQHSQVIMLISLQFGGV